jgi:hypothetical protein
MGTRIGKSQVSTSRGEDVMQCPTSQENQKGDNTSAKRKQGFIAQSHE